MRIESIEINNYRQYKKLNFSFENQRNGYDLNVIIAQNGVGKSNFLNAITWCLYEEENHLQSKDKILPIPNTKVIEDTPEQKHIKVSIKLELLVDGERQTIKRVVDYVKCEKAKDKINKLDSKIVLTKLIKEDMFTSKIPHEFEGESAIAMINKIFPKGISQYFFFDNEQMNNYFTQNDGSAIKSAINEISKISLIQAVTRRLYSVQNEYHTNLGNTDYKIKKLKEEVEQLRQNKEFEEKELNETNDSISEANIRHSELNASIGAASNLKTLEFQRENLTKEKTNLKVEMDKCKNSINEFVIRYETLIKLYPSIIKTLKLIEEKDNQHKLPPEISLDVLKRTLSNQKCELCGGELSETQIELIAKKAGLYDLATPVYKELMLVKGKLTELKLETEQYETKKEKLINQYKIIADKQEKNETNLIENTKQIRSIADQDKIRNDIDERDNLDILLNKYIENRGVITQRLKDAKNKLEYAEHQLEIEIEKMSRENKNAEIASRIDELIQITKKAEQEISNEIKMQISSETYENFKKLIWKENTYSSISIDDNYNVDLLHKNGYSAIGSTSAAERALLALSFTNAIHHVSGFDSPIVIDSPVGRVSDINRKKFSETLAKISETKQIIMLFTPDEYSDDVKNVFDNIAYKAYASMDKNEDETEIIRG